MPQPSFRDVIRRLQQLLDDPSVKTDDAIQVLMEQRRRAVVVYRECEKNEKPGFDKRLFDFSRPLPKELEDRERHFESAWKVIVLAEQWSNPPQVAYTQSNPLPTYSIQRLVEVEKGRFATVFDRNAWRQLVADDIEIMRLFSSRAGELEEGNSAEHGKPDASRAYNYSRDFTSVISRGVTYRFNKTQARCFEYLFEEWEKGGLGLSEETIGDLIKTQDSNFRLAHKFREKGKMHAAWGTMIKACGKGIFCLAHTESPENHT